MSIDRGAGILLSITSLPSAYGIGTLGYEAYRFVDKLTGMKQRYWQILPLGPTNFGNSPYQSSSAFAGNPYLIDLDMLIEKGLLTHEEVQSFDWGEGDQEIDYGKIYSNRFKVLWMAYERFDIRDREFIRFYSRNTFWLEDYSLFMALKSHFNGKEWLMWDQDIRDRKPEAIRTYRRRLEKEIFFWEFCQFQFFEQWEKLRKYAHSHGIQIIGDVPLYVALDSVDVWAHTEQFQLKEDLTPALVAGCPPDYFSHEGQKWGNPLFNWNQMEQDDFMWWRARIKRNVSMFDVIRLDHFIGMVRYFAIPPDAEKPAEGKWMKAPGRKLTDAIKEAAGEHAKIIVEDVDAHVPGVRKLANRNDWPGIAILLFAFEEGSANEYLPHNYTDSNRVVYVGTHDNETVVGYFQDKKDHELEYLYDYLNIHSREEIPDAMIRLAYSSVADVVILQLQDVLKLGKDARMNEPNSIGNNWCWRFINGTISQERMDFIRKMATIYRR